MAVPTSDDGQRPGAFHLNAPVVGGWGGAVMPFLHTGCYFAQSWRDYLGQEPDGVPIARPTIALAPQTLRDEVVLIGLKARRPVSQPREFERISREVSLEPLVPVPGRFIYAVAKK